MPLEWLIDLIKEWVIAQGYATEAWVLAKVYATEAWVLEWITPVNVSGDLAPDGTCTYFKAGTYEGKPYYRRSDGKYFIWWYEGPDYWIISVTLGDAVPGNWYRVAIDILGPYQPFAPFTGVATVAPGYKIACHAFVDRGDPAAADLVLGGMVADGNWHDWDISGIVPAGSKAVLLEIWIANTDTFKTISIRTDGNANWFNVKFLTTQVANIAIQSEGTIPLPVSRIIEYNLPAGGWTAIFITVKGWWP